MASDLPTTYEDPVPIAIIGGTGLGSLPTPPFKPLAQLPPVKTPWGLTSAPITILSYTPTSSLSSTSTKPIVLAFLPRHGPGHSIPPHQIPYRANVAALRRIGVRAVVAFSAVGSLREEVKPRDFCIVRQIVDWTKGVRPWTFFEGDSAHTGITGTGVVGHVSMADPIDNSLADLVSRAVGKSGVLTGSDDGGATPDVHGNIGLICIEGPQFSTRAESHLYRSFATQPPISAINMSAMPEAKLFREAEIAYALVAMSTDYDSWHDTREGVSVEMVMGHMRWNGINAKRAVEAVLAELAGDEQKGGSVVGERLIGSSRMSVMGLGKGSQGEGVDKLRWLFGDKWVDA